MQRYCALLLLIAGLLCGRALGCSCVGPGGCRALPLKGTLFVGDVLSVKDVQAQADRWPSRSFRFKVTEALAGSERVGDEVEVATGMGGGDCGYEFTVGQRYFVDAYAGASGLGTGICSHTMPVAQATTLMRELHMEAAGARLPDLTGTVKSASIEDWARSKPMPGIEVVLTSAVDGSQHRAATDAEGIYTMAVLPPGKYSLKATLPPRMATRQDTDEKPAEIVIPDAHGTGAACHLDVNAFPSGSIRGKLLYPDGKPVDGLISAYRVGAPGNGEQGGGWLIDKDGSFELDLLAAGDYRLSVCAPDGKTNALSWYPGTGNKSEAKLVHVADGEATTGVDFVFRP